MEMLIGKVGGIPIYVGKQNPYDVGLTVGELAMSGVEVIGDYQPIDIIREVFERLYQYQSTGLTPDVIEAMQNDLINANMNLEHLAAEVERLEVERDTLKRALEIIEKRGYVDCMAAERQSDGTCLGYSAAEDDEPCEQCKHCPKNSAYYEEEQS